MLEGGGFARPQETRQHGDGEWGTVAFGLRGHLLNGVVHGCFLLLQVEGNVEGEGCNTGPCRRAEGGVLARLVLGLGLAGWL